MHTAFDFLDRVDLSDAIASRIRHVMEVFAVPGEPTVSVASAPKQARAVAVVVDGRRIGYPASFLRRLWFAKADPQFHPAAFTSSAGGRFPETWLVDCAEQGLITEVRDVLLRLPAEVLSLRPSWLLAQSVVGSPDTLLIGRTLLDRGIALPPIAVLEDLLEVLRETGHNPESALEELHARFQLRALELHVDSETFTRLGGPDHLDCVVADDKRLDGDLVSAFAATREHHLLELGVRRPIELVRSTHVDPNTMRVRINARLGPPIPVPGPDEVGVARTSESLRRRDIPARPLVDAVSGHELAAVPVADAARLDTVAIIPTAYIAGAFARAVTPLAYRLLSVDDVEEDLAALEEIAPSVVHGALSRFGLFEITRLFRELVREQVSMRDPWGVLNAMIAFDLLRRKPGSYHPGDRYTGSVATRLGTSTGPRADGELLAFTRSQLSDRVVYDTHALSTLDEAELYAYVTHVSFEDRLTEVIESPGALEEIDDALDGVRDAVWEAVGSAEDAQPIIVTTRSVRRALRDALTVEIPGVRVLARGELPPELRLVPIGHIRFDAGVRASP